MDKDNIPLVTWDFLAPAYNDKFMDLDLYDDTYDAFCSLIQTASPQIFEIGCGPGNITRYLRRKRPDFNIRATDASPKMIEIARKNVPGVTFEVMDCRDISAITSKYDGIVCGFCMPYLSKEECNKLINNCSQLLNEGSIFYLSTIEGDYAKSGFEVNSKGDAKIFMYYHQADYLTGFLTNAGFKVAQVFRKPYLKTETETSTHLIFIARKG